MTELEAALAEFAQTRSRALADRIERLGRAATPSYALPGRTSDFHRDWLELVPDPRARTWCLDRLLDLTGRDDAVRERFAALAQLRPDPRVARALRRIVDVIETDGADDAYAAIARHSEAGDYRDPFAALFAAVYASPDDDAQRAVLADALTEADDPRGELIALQLRDQPADQPRIRELVQAHGRGWLGSLGGIADRVEFRRGFVACMRLTGTWSAAWWQAFSRAPELATVEEIDQANPHVVPAGLRALEVAWDDHWDDIAAMPLPHLRELRMFYAHLDRNSARDRALARYLATHPQITRVGCTLETFDRLPASVVRRIDQLDVRGVLAATLRLWQQFPQLEQLRCTDHHTIELRRDLPELVRIDASKVTGMIDLRLLPSTVRRVEIVGTRAAIDALRAARPRFDITVLDPPAGLLT